MKRLIPLIVLSLVLVFLIVPHRAVFGQTQHSITISWTYTQGTDAAVGFNVLRSTASGGPYAKINAALIPVSTLSYVDTSGVGGTKYFYVVNAQDAGGNLSTNSAEASATMIGNPNPPSGVAAIAQ